MEILIENTISSEVKKIVLPVKNGLNFYAICNIIRCHSQNSYTEFFIQEEEEDVENKYFKLVVSKGFEHYQDYLVSKGDFYRVHNQHLVNIRHISKFINTNNSYLIMDDLSGEMIPVARARKEAFLNYLKTKGFQP